nr:hypothetical protein [Mariprofundus aestuarium]
MVSDPFEILQYVRVEGIDQWAGGIVCLSNEMLLAVSSLKLIKVLLYLVDV